MSGRLGFILVWSCSHWVGAQRHHPSTQYHGRGPFFVNSGGKNMSRFSCLWRSHTYSYSGNPQMKLWWYRKEREREGERRKHKRKEKKEKTLEEVNVWSHRKTKCAKLAASNITLLVSRSQIYKSSPVHLWTINEEIDGTWIHLACSSNQNISNIWKIHYLWNQIQ